MIARPPMTCSKTLLTFLRSLPWSRWINPPYGWSIGPLDLLHLLDPDVTPAHLVRAFFLANAVDLQADETMLVLVVGEVGGGNSIEPRPVVVALDDDLVLVPAGVLEGFLGIGLDLGDPLVTARLVV